MQEALGLEKQKLEAHLYDLLLYEPGSFFLPHSDGEKLDRMVATLVVVLPSSFEGGELVVRHDGRGTDDRLRQRENAASASTSPPSTPTASTRSGRSARAIGSASSTT